MNPPEWVQWLGIGVALAAVIYQFLRSSFQQQMIDNNEINIIHTKRYVRFKENEYMFLVGDFSHPQLTDKRVKFRNEISEEDMAKARREQEFQIIDLANQTCFDPETGEWIEIPQG